MLLLVETLVVVEPTLELNFVVVRTIVLEDIDSEEREEVMLDSTEAIEDETEAMEDEAWVSIEEMDDSTEEALD